MTGIPEAEPRGADFLDDRAAYWSRLRSLGRVVRVHPEDCWDWDGDSFYITSRADVVAALRDETLVPWHFDWKLKTTAFGRPVRLVPFACAPTEHERVSRILYPLFSPRALARYEHAIRASAAELVDSIAPRGACDATVAIGVEYPCAVLLVVLGLPPDNQIPALYRAAVRNDEQPLISRLLTTAHELALSDEQPRTGILWTLLTGLEDQGFPLTGNDVLGVLALIFLAGIHNVQKAIISALFYLARDPQLRSLLRAKPEHLAGFVDEIIRLEAPTATVARLTTQPTKLGDVLIPSGSQLFLCLEAASREDGGDTISANPQGIPRRQRHWAFGGGIYQCLGASLARLEMAIFVQEWLRQIPEFELLPAFQPAADGEATLTALPLRWDTT